MHWVPDKLDGLQKQNKGKRGSNAFRKDTNSSYRETQMLMVVYFIRCIESGGGNNIARGYYGNNMPSKALT
jgi:hypothetical protein